MSSLSENISFCGRFPFVDYIRLVCQKWELISFDVWNIISADYKQKLFPPDKIRVFEL